MKLLIKGILTHEDASLCVEHGVDGIIVSNHGGRVVDSGLSTIEVLPEIARSVGGRILILIDSGFRRGSDFFKALALGASAVPLCGGSPPSIRKASRRCWACAARGTRGHHAADGHADPRGHHPRARPAARVGLPMAAGGRVRAGPGTPGARQGLERCRLGAAKPLRVQAGYGASEMPGTGDDGTCQVSREALFGSSPGFRGPTPASPWRPSSGRPSEPWEMLVVLAGHGSDRNLSFRRGLRAGRAG